MKVNWLLLLISISCLSVICYALKSMTDDEIKKMLIDGSVSEFEASKGKFSCPCPYSRDSNGNDCGQNSAYFKALDEEKPKCYPEDLRNYEVNDFRSEHDIPKPATGNE